MKQSYLHNQIDEVSVGVLLCTYNGEAYLREQIDSIIAQDYESWCIYISDDGSSDRTIEILNEYQKKLGDDKLKIYQGPRQGYSWNFLKLLRSVEDKHNYYALCDQDDIWLSNKLSRGIEILSSYNFESPNVYCGRTTLVDEENKIIGFSPLFKKETSLNNALIQSIAGGNTMIINKAAARIINKTPMDCEIVSHDWWIYILVSAVGGIVKYDYLSTIHYRQHAQNLVGSNLGFYPRLKRIKGLLCGRFRRWSQMNIDALSKMHPLLLPESNVVIKKFDEARKEKFFKRIVLYSKLKLYRQTKLGSLALFIAVILNKV